jgi:hypothetical protein
MYAYAHHPKACLEKGNVPKAFSSALSLALRYRNDDTFLRALA